MSVDDVAWFVPHQANVRIIEAAAQRLGIPTERTIVNIERYGNTSSASIPLALFEAVDDGRVRDGDLVLLSGFGAGMTWASALLRWGVAMSRQPERRVRDRRVARHRPRDRRRARARRPSRRLLLRQRRRRRAGDACALVEAEGGKAVAVRADVADTAAVDRAFDEVESALGPVTCS